MTIALACAGALIVGYLIGTTRRRKASQTTDSRRRRGLERPRRHTDTRPYAAVTIIDLPDTEPIPAAPYRVRTAQLRVVQ